MALTLDQQIHAVLVYDDREIPVKIRLVRTTDEVYARFCRSRPSGEAAHWMIIPKRGTDQGDAFTRVVARRLASHLPTKSGLRFLEKPRLRASVAPDPNEGGYLVWRIQQELEAYRLSQGASGWDGKSLRTLHPHLAWVIADFLAFLHDVAGCERFTTHSGKPIHYESFFLSEK